MLPCDVFDAGGFRDRMFGRNGFPSVKLSEEHYVDGGHCSVLSVDPIFDPAVGIQAACLVSASPIG